MDAVEEGNEFGKTPRQPRFSISRTDTVSLLDKLRNEGKVESPGNTLTFAAQTSEGEGMDPFSGERNAPSLIPFPGDDIPRASLDSSRSSIRSHSQQSHQSHHSHRQNNSQDSLVQAVAISRSFEIPTGMTNLLDSYPGDIEEPLLPHISMSDGLFDEMKEEMKDAVWMPDRNSGEVLVDADGEENVFSVMGTNASNAATLRQRSFTLPLPASNTFTATATPNKHADADESQTQPNLVHPAPQTPHFHASLAQSSPAMSRILREESFFSPSSSSRSLSKPSGNGRNSVEPKTPIHAISNMTAFFTPPQSAPPMSAPAGSTVFSPIEHRRVSSYPVDAPHDVDTHPMNINDLFDTSDKALHNLRKELTVKSALIEHLESELFASQSLVTSLTSRYNKARETAQHYKDEETKHKSNLGKLKKKCVELEGMIEEANGERSQRSLLDECTADAMRVLQER